jgi:hypothetical protein
VLLFTPHASSWQCLLVTTVATVGYFEVYSFLMSSYQDVQVRCGKMGQRLALLLC